MQLPIRRLALAFAGGFGLLGALLTTGCGPGLIAAGGGTVGAIFGIQAAQKDDKKDSSPNLPDTNFPPVVVISGLDREPSPATIHFTVVDANEDNVDIEVQYSTNNGSSFQTATPDATTVLTGLPTTQSGVDHTFLWSFGQDVGLGHTGNLHIRIRAHDGQASSGWVVLTDLTIGNDAPLIDESSIAVSNSGPIVLFQFNLIDDDSDPADIEVRYTKDLAQSWQTISAGEFFGNAPLSLPTSPGAGSPAQFTWDSKMTLPDFTGEVWVELRPKDQPANYPEPTLGSVYQIQGIQIDNQENSPPVLNLTTNFDGQTFTDFVDVSFTLLDEESDAAIVFVAFSLDGIHYEEATLVNQFAPGAVGPFLLTPNPSPYSFRWNALADLAEIDPYVNSYSNVRLAILPADADAGELTTTDPFTLIGNAAPEVLGVAPLQNSGNITFAITVADSGSHPVSAVIEYSTDGNLWNPVPAPHWAQGNPGNLTSSPTGTENFLTWNTVSTLGNTNHPGVLLRVTPTDHPEGATPVADLTGSQFVSDPFPVINNLADTNPASITIITTDAGGTPTPNPIVTAEPGGADVYFDRTISPPGAMLVHDTFWGIQQTGSDRGQLVDVGGGPLPFATGSFTFAGMPAEGDTIQIHDGINPVVEIVFIDTTQGLSPLSPDQLPVDLALMSSVADVVDAVANTITSSSSVRLIATDNSPTVELQHEFACRLGNASSVDAGFGNADDIVSSPSGLLSAVTQLNGGASVERVRYIPPATAPPQSTSVTIRCGIDNPLYFPQVQDTHVLFWGQPVADVTVYPETPPSVELMLGTQFQFNADVTPTEAPQQVTWSVVGGSANGSVNSSGLYTAPQIMPGSSTVFVRATSVDPNAPVGESAILLRPKPSSVTVSPTQPAELTLGDSRLFSAQVSPGGAFQDVYWEIWHDGQNQGPGPGPFGELQVQSQTSALYIAPGALVSPPQVQIRATSVHMNSIYGTRTQGLVAPPPTDFQVGPSGLELYAEGAGAQFFAFNFTPSNANTNVSWTLVPSQQHGSINQSTGEYTPPTETEFSGPSTVVTVWAQSSADTNINRSVQFTLHPKQPDPPTGIIGLPSVAYTFTSGPAINFAPVVQPSSAPQDVTWSILTGSQGGFTGNTYDPGSTVVDAVVVARCASSVDPAVFVDVEIRVGGRGTNWQSDDGMLVERSGHSSVWDPINNRLWIVGGNSPRSGNSFHDVEVLYVTFANDQPTVHVAPGTLANRVQSNAPNTSSTVYDAANQRLISVFGNGTNHAGVATLSLSPSPAANWTIVATGGSGNAPALSDTRRYNVWINTFDNELTILTAVDNIHTLNLATNNWGRTSIPTSTQAPASVFDTSVVLDSDAGRSAFFVGSHPSLLINEETSVFRLSTTSRTWTRYTNAGSHPNGTTLRRVAALRTGPTGDIHLFGGIDQFNQVSSSHYTVSLDNTTTTATWQPPIGQFMATPHPRYGGTLTMRGIDKAILYGGRGANGPMRDQWTLSLSSGSYTFHNGGNMAPDPRRHAAGAWLDGMGYIFGGETANGANNELWTFEFNPASQQPLVWQRKLSSTPPPGLIGASMVADEVNDRLIVFGGAGQSNGGASSNAIRIYTPSNNQWLTLSAQNPPPVRMFAAIAYDPSSERLFIYGGRNQTMDHRDLWTVALGAGSPSWTRLDDPGQPNLPSARFGSTMGYDAANDRLLIVGGFAGAAPTRQLYSFHLVNTTWTLLSVAGSQSAEDVFDSGAIYDPFMSRFLHAPPGKASAAALVMTTPGPGWQDITTPPSPGNAGATTGVYDPVSRRYFFLFGRRSVSGTTVATSGWKSVDFE